MAKLALGIDTGGTFTDGVIFDLEKNMIIREHKTLTIRQNLSGAVANCLEKLLEGYAAEDLKEIRMVSLSTTLATNAIVEGQGAEVGLLLIGAETDQELPTPYYACLDGGCNIKGRIKKEVDPAAAREAVNALKSQVDAFAVSGYLSIRNPVQELKVADLIRDLTGYPVVSAHQLSSELGFYERTITAVFNARLIPLITELIAAVKENINSLGIEAPLMIVKGDGSLISEERARERPIETSLSGPAASMVGAMVLTGIKDGVVVDMGGTTTDAAVLQEGRPRLTEKGALVGGWLTRVKAAEITTEGLGGDSLIQVSKEGILKIGPQRVFPLSWAVNEHPHLLAELKEVDRAKYYPLESQPVTILFYIKEPVNFEHSRGEEEIMGLIREKPHSLYYLARELKKEADLLPWKRLVNSGLVHRASLTPTDLLHAAGKFTEWDSRGAELGIKIQARRYHSSAEDFSAEAIREIHYRIGVLLLDVLIRHQGGRVSLEEEGSRYLLEAMLKPGGAAPGPVSFEARLNIPLVAVGAPVKAYFPPIGEMLNGRLYLPDSAEVANAVGTVSGKVVERLTIMIKPGERGGYLVHLPEGREVFADFKEALSFGREKGEEIIRQQARGSGAADLEVLVKQEDKYSDYGGVVGSSQENKLFIESRLEITGVGTPWTLN